MKQDTKWLKVMLITVIILAILSPVSVLYFKAKAADQKAKDDVQISLLANAMRKAYKEIETHNDTIDVLKDSIFRLSVQKGQVEIELNRKESQFHDQVNRYYVYKVQRDTIQLLGDCDSIVNEVQPYVIQNFQYRRLIDTLYRKLVSVADQYDSISVIQSHMTDSVLQKNSRLTDDNNKLQVKKLKAQKFGLIASIIAIGEAAIIFLIK